MVLSISFVRTKFPIFTSGDFVILLWIFHKSPLCFLSKDIICIRDIYILFVVLVGLTHKPLQHLALQSSTLVGLLSDFVGLRYFLSDFGLHLGLYTKNI